MKPLYQKKDLIPDPATNKNRWEVYDMKQGGMGWVYIVYDHKTGEPFAVKTYKDEWLQTEKAKEQFKKEAMCSKGVALAILNRQQEAIACCNKALEIDPKDINAWNNKGVALMELNYNQEAIECYNKALEINPKDSEAWYNIGIALARLKYLPQALECFQKANKLGHHNAEQAIAYYQQLLQQQGEL